MEDVPRLIGERVQLFTLELQRAKQAFIVIAALAVVAALLLLTAWFVIWGAAIAGLIEAGLAWGWAVLIVLVIHIGGAFFALRYAMSMTRYLAFPATARHLTVRTRSPAKPAKRLHEPRARRLDRHRDRGRPSQRTMTTTNPPDAKKPDLETQIREAEQRVISADRNWRLHNDALAEAVRGKAGRAAKVGGTGLGVAAVGLLTTMVLRWRLGSKAARKRDRFFAETIAKLRQQPMTSARMPEAARSVVPPAVAKSPRWHGALAAIGTLLGAAATSSLGRKPAGGGLLSMLMGFGLPMVTRWLRGGRDQPKR